MKQRELNKEIYRTYHCFSEQKSSELSGKSAPKEGLPNISIYQAQMFRSKQFNAALRETIEMNFKYKLNKLNQYKKEMNSSMLQKNDNYVRKLNV
ncbi:uncharacterized protein cubi_02288 [Cryptosporidium ubiquitum]|uniref:Uncharacterized protein n=1 Tax=Cryptosporidium ubiquitum TaxID=857276 RepID=A0A1J4MFS4_9CRYT|nr:uncharacterized protein cubi_02288 [Cryptosporidium ubiquitum]OII73057.1 hypothetical protein cubi_02288 [Cryptosporidium ubiquitum]